MRFRGGNLEDRLGTHDWCLLDRGSCLLGFGVSSRVFFSSEGVVLVLRVLRGGKSFTQDGLNGCMKIEDCRMDEGKWAKRVLHSWVVLDARYPILCVDGGCPQAFRGNTGP